MKRKLKTVSLDSLVIGTLPKELQKSIGDMKITVEDLQVWDNSRPGFYLTKQNGRSGLTIHLFLPLKKILLWAGSIISILGVVIKFIVSLNS
jgi:hypothetical protein